MRQLRRIGVFAAGKVTAMVVAVVSLVTTIPVLVGTGVAVARPAFSDGATFDPSTMSFLPADTVTFGGGLVASIAMMLALQVFMGFVMGAIVALAYNLVASLGGGLTLEFDEASA